MRQLIARISLTIFLFANVASASDPKGFHCNFEAPTFAEDYQKALAVVVGKFGKTVQPRVEVGLGGSAEFIIESILKPSTVLDRQTRRDVAGKQVMVLPHEASSKSTYLVFCNPGANGKIAGYRGVEITPGSKLINYLEAVGRRLQAPQHERLRFYFDYLGDSDADISRDAHREFERAAYADLRRTASTLQPHAVADLLSKPATPTDRLRLYSTLLGHCGGNMHAHILRKIIADPKRSADDKAALFFGYVLLEPQAGWDHVHRTLSDPREDFVTRYRALGTLRLLRDERPDLVTEPELLRGLVTLLDQPDMADFAIDDLRKWRKWDFTEQIIGLAGRPTHDIKVVQRAVLRFALQSPQPRAAEFVRIQRLRDAEWVKDNEELLKAEN